MHINPVLIAAKRKAVKPEFFNLSAQRSSRSSSCVSDNSKCVALSPPTSALPLVALHCNAATFGVRSRPLPPPPPLPHGFHAQVCVAGLSNGGTG